MTVDDFLALEHSEKFDFTDECACDNYKAISNPISKYCIYKAYFRAQESNWISRGKKLYNEGFLFSKNCHESYAGIIDPDSKSPLLQEIYRLLWDKECLAYSLSENKNGEPQVNADTMNSAQTTLNQTMERFNIGTACDPKGKASTNRLIYLYAKDGDNLSVKLEDVVGLRPFLLAYHTLGNFIPTPFNTERTARTKDYWDLTLRRIYKWYCAKSEEDKNDELHNLLLDKENVVEGCRQWLLAFGTWDNFVEMNYLQDFVNVDANGICGAPKELWEGHFSKALLPENEEDIKQFYTNASSWIRSRGNCMIIALKEKLRQNKNKDNIN